MGCFITHQFVIIEHPLTLLMSQSWNFLAKMCLCFSIPIISYFEILMEFEWKVISHILTSKDKDFAKSI